ncbi:MAG: DUF4258 domain-containing protein [Treponema sp.]|nr:DUF4258 domain-containing protein [Treponema sp.]
MDIAQIKSLLGERKIGWSLHSAQMMQKRAISRLDVLSCLENGEIIEDYPNSFPHPSCLVFGRSQKNEPLHVVVGAKDDMLMIITAYFPSEDKFESDLKTRRKI